ncbi:MAG: hypothetical protein ABTA16_03385 [Niallia sp.]
MNRYQIEIAKLENRTPLFYYPYHVELTSDLARKLVAAYFYRFTTSNILSFDKGKHVKEMLTEENLKKLSGKYTFHYNDPKQTEGDRISKIKHHILQGLGRKGIDGFLTYASKNNALVPLLVEGRDFEVIVGERVEIEQPQKLTFDDLPDLMGINEE